MEDVVGMEVDDSVVDMELVRSVSFSAFLDISPVEKNATVDLNTGRPKVWAHTTAYYERQRHIRRLNRTTLRAQRDMKKNAMIHRGCYCKTSEEDVCRFCSHFVLTAPVLALEAAAWRRA